MPDKSKKYINICAFQLGQTDKKIIGGGDLILPGMARYFPKEIELTAITTAISKDLWKKTKKKKHYFVSDFPMEASQNPFLIFFLYLKRSIHAVYLAKKEKYDFFYSSTNIFPDVLAGFISKLLSSQSIWISRIHHIVPEPGKREGNSLVNLFSFILDRFVLLLIKLKSDQIIVLNNSLKKELEDKGFKNLKVLGAGVDIPKKFTGSKKTFAAIFVGRIHDTKGAFDLVPIWDFVNKSKPKAKLAIIGSGPQNKITKLKNQINNAHYPKNIFYLGYRNDTEKNILIQKSRMLLFLDREAGWGLAIAEAFANKTPVIAYEQQYIKDVFPKGLVTAPQKNIKKISSLIIYYLKYDNSRIKLSKDAYQTSRKFSWRSTGKEFIDGLIKLKKN